MSPKLIPINASSIFVEIIVFHSVWHGEYIGYRTSVMQYLTRISTIIMAECLQNTFLFIAVWLPVCTVEETIIREGKQQWMSRVTQSVLVLCWLSPIVCIKYFPLPHFFINNISFCSQFVEACFGPFSAQLAKVGSYRALEKEAQDLIGALHEKLERRRRDLQTGLGVGVRSKIKLTTLELKVCYISIKLIFTYEFVIISRNNWVEKNALL